MLAPILLSVALIVITVLLHSLGTLLMIRVFYASISEQGGREKRARRILILTGAVVVLLLVHLVEISVWAVAYLSVLKISVARFEEAFYFSAVTFSTLGYGDITLPPPWRVLSSLQAVSGVLIFGWSTAILVGILQRVIEVAGFDVRIRPKVGPPAEPR
jgi:voltage-gated potassium channel